MDGSLIGRTLGNYEILELLGIGGAAEVYRALSLATGREMALKVLCDRADPSMILRFTREAKALGQLEHPNVVKVFEAGFEDGERFLAMELAMGGSLKDRLQKAPLEWREAVRVGLQIARALEHAHQHGIIHRDLKPGNVMFDGDGNAKLMDFGLAHLSDASAMTRTGTVMGTVFYLSPEQAVGKRVDARSDLYALGAVLYEMVIGEPPFTGPSAVSIIYKHLNEQPPKLCQIDDSLPPALESIVERLLQKDPDRRFGSATETILALEALAGVSDEAAVTFRPGIEASSDEDEMTAVPLAGRQEELDTLREALGRVLSGLGSTVLISGEAGTGKTRLAQELFALARESNAFTLAGSCLYGDAPNPYAVWGEMVEAFRDQWLPTRQRGGEGAHQEVEALANEVERVLRIGRLDSGDDASTWMHQASLIDDQAHAFELVAQFFLLASRVRPVVVLVDDLQWASPTTLQLYHYLARAVRGARILLLGTYRPEELLPGAAGKRHPLRETIQRMSREKLFGEIRLDVMGPREVAQITASALNVSTVDPEFTDLLHRESEGNPFYLLEMIALLREQGVLQSVGDHWELTSDLDDIDIPGSVYDVIMRRIERASEQDRDLLDWAAVVGQRLDVAVLAPLVGGTRLELMKRLYTLEQRYGLLTSDQYGFQFGHTTIREILYGELPEPLRRECHLMVGEVLEERCAGNVGPHVYDLARHFVRAGDARRGFRYATLAAEKSAKALAISEAAGYYQEALEILGRTPSLGAGREREMDLRHRHGKLLSILGRMDEAQQAFEAALAISRQHGDRKTEAEVLLALSGLHGRAGNWDSAVELAEQSLSVADLGHHAKCKADALLSTGFYAFEQGDWESAIGRLKAALAIATESDNTLQRARILGNMAIMYNARGRARRAIELYRESIETFERLNQPLDAVRGLSNLGFSHHSLGEHDEALRCYRLALERLGKMGDVREQGLLYLHIAETSLAQDRLQEARENCTLATRRFARLGFELGIADVDRVYAGIAQCEGRWRVAERYLREALSVYEAHGDQLNTAETHEELSRLLVARGDQAEAEEQLSRSRLIFDRLYEEAPSDPA